MELDENGTAVPTDKRKCAHSDLNLQIIRSDLSFVSSEMKAMRMRMIPTKTLTKRRRKNRLRRSRKKKVLLQREGLNNPNLR